MPAKLILSGLFLSLITMHAVAAKDLSPEAIKDVIQSIQVVNLLANTELADTGMTPTPIIVKYFNGGREPCWISTLNFKEDTTIHAGPWLGCINKIIELVVTPVMVADKLKTYQPQLSVSIDPTKYSHQITVVQDQAPSFDPQNGMVTASGSMKVKVQSQFK